MDKLKSIKCIFMDVDGTMTDGSIYYDAVGNELKSFDVKDGLGIKVAISAGIDFVILTGRKSAMVERRAQELGIKYLFSGVQSKLPVLHQFASEHCLGMREICYIGDDWNDYQAMQIAGVSVCPADAPDEIKELSDIVLKKAGGHGAIRECIEIILKKQGRWKNCCQKLYCEIDCK